jgi:hypothetical protein
MAIHSSQVLAAGATFDTPAVSRRHKPGGRAEILGMLRVNHLVRTSPAGFDLGQTLSELGSDG